MQQYKNIVVALDFSKASQQVIDKAIQISKSNHAKLHLIHVIDIIIPMMDFDPLMFSYEVPVDNIKIKKSSDKKLEKLKADYSTIDIITHTLEGTAKNEIINYAELQQTDLIIIGSHGHSGIAMLLGSTIDSVLHHAKCDVLAVRIKD